MGIRQLRFNKLHSYTVHQWFSALYCPSNAHNVRKRGIIKTL